MRQATLFDATDRKPVRLARGVYVLQGFVETAPLLQAIRTIEKAAPFRHMVVPSGQRMSVAMTNAGALGWITDRDGYRYVAVDPQSDQPWPRLPDAFLALALNAAQICGFGEFVPDACLINRYAPGARLTLHQDRNERDFSAPIVSASIGAPATFLLGGLKRGDRVRSIPLADGDVMVWGGPARLVYHGVRPLGANAPGAPGAPAIRYNLTLRKAG
jgi:alkylated DNA repair protein (DNA oxidative demethylase)